MGFIGGTVEVKNAIIKGLHSNVNQLEKLLKTSCGGEGCDCHKHYNNLQKLLKSVQENCKKYDALQTQIAQKLAENKNSQVSVSGDVDSLKQQVEELQKEIFSQSSTLTTQINIVISAVQSKISELDKKKKDVDTLQSQVNDLKKKIDAKQNNDVQLEDLQEELQKAQENFPEKDAKSLDSHQTSMMSLNSLQSLCQHCNEVSKMKQNNEQPKKLLESLCGGLEKFLGYSNGNYTGEGIVYSDLDRLCDGVMAFLHGVLESVKDDDNVTTYDKDDLKITKVIDTLNTSVGKGREAFQAAVRQVSEWLTKHGAQVDKATRGVTAELGKLITKLSSGAGENNNEYYKEVENQEGAPLSEQLKEWTSTLQKIEDEVTQIETQHAKPLDSSLRDNILREINVVKKSVKMLHDSSKEKLIVEQAFEVDVTLAHERKELKEKIEEESERVRKELTQQEEKVKKEIDKESREVRRKLAEQFVMLRGIAEDLKDAKNAQFKSIYGTMDESQKMLKDFDDGCENDIWRYLYEIKMRLNNFVGQNATLLTLCRILKDGVEGLDKKLQEDLRTLRKSIDKGISAYIGQVKRAAYNATQKLSTQVDLSSIANGLFEDSKLRKWLWSVHRGNVSSHSAAQPQAGDVTKGLQSLTKFAAVGSDTANMSAFEAILQDLQKHAGNVFQNADVDDLSKIKDVMNKCHDARVSLEEAVIKVQAELTSLESLPGIVDANNNHIMGLLNSIKNDLDNKFAHIYEHIKNSEDALSSAIQAVEYNVRTAQDKAMSSVDALKDSLTKTVIDAFEASRRSVSQLQTTLLQKVVMAFEEITKRVKNQFAAQHKSDLEALKKLVTEQRTAITAIIEKDKRTGIKGLLKGLRGMKVTATAKGPPTFESSTKLLDDLKEDEIKNDFIKLTGKFKAYSENILIYIGKQINDAFKEPTKKAYYDSLQSIYDKLAKLLEHLGKDDRKFHFDSEFSKLLAELKSLLGGLNPSSFSHLSLPVVQAIKDGLEAFVTQLGFAYVNEYSSAPKINWEDKVFMDGNKCANVCLTTIFTLFHRLHKLFYNCSTRWKGINIDGVGRKDGALKHFLRNEGFDSVNLINKEHSGWNVALRLSKKFRDYEEFNASPSTNHINFNTYHESIKNSIKSENVLGRLFGHLESYLSVCHISTFTATRYPCSVFEMLGWLGGLKYNAFYYKVRDQCNASIKDENNRAPKNILADIVAHHLPSISAPTYRLLVAITGTGDSHSHYGCEYLGEKIALICF
ncbi:hypothetical protein, conserved [Babesia ovata]|uniref:Extracellular matrix-binding ebh n=1 Tax=Babesia ovata TaxID=189622 RepID=A0A2H6KIW6_9APIC|nr:uncharacterized protein BOVATA_044210 [Babesia ovata]GBE62928.1 hypothetical protein, conserved [Babesia ovata]